MNKTLLYMVAQK